MSRRHTKMKMKKSFANTIETMCVLLSKVSDKRKVEVHEQMFAAKATLDENTQLDLLLLPEFPTFRNALKEIFHRDDEMALLVTLTFGDTRGLDLHALDRTQVRLVRKMECYAKCGFHSVTGDSDCLRLAYSVSEKTAPLAIFKALAIWLIGGEQ